MGSLVLAYPMFQQLKQRYPGARVSVLLFRKNREMLEILNVVPAENIHTINDASMSVFAASTVRAIYTMHQQKYDAVVDCELFARFSSLLSYFSGAKLRAGFGPYTQEGLYRGGFINRPVLYNPYLHISQQYLNLLEALDSCSVPTAKRSIENSRLEVPTLVLDVNEREVMMDRLYRDFPVCVRQKLVLIYPSGGVLSIRAWPQEYYCQLAKALLADGYVVAIIGMHSDEELAQQIVAYCKHPNCIDLTGYTRTIRELMVLFFHASLLVTNDGGPGQFAAMTPVPTIIFYGPETPVLYGSHSRNAVFFYISMSCSPCLTAYNHRSSPCDGDNQCLRRINPDKVYEKAQELLAALAD